MSTSWYYVQGSERVGPVEQDQLADLVNNGVLGADSYVWKRGFDNWCSLSTIDELSYLLENGDDDVNEIPSMGGLPIQEEAPQAPLFDLHSIREEEKVFSIKVGYDRGGHEAEYGPFSLIQLKRAYNEQRVNEKTFIFTPGMSTWVLLGDFDLYDKISGNHSSTVDESDRRVSVRKPFVARLLFHDNEKVYEGICRDVSVGGLQVLVSHFPCDVGDEVSMNVHPDNSDYHFTATGKVVRKLEGDSGFSLRFEELSGDAKGSIESYISASD